MKNSSLAKDYVSRAVLRLLALDVLLKGKAYADVVRESQEVVELALKGLLRHSTVEVPRIHDVSDILLEHTELLPQGLQTHVEKLAEISRTLRRDRELAFYGAEDLTPSEFYKKKDAEKAIESARWVAEIVAAAVLPKK
jgi:HEPN domain-containing protein